MAEKLTFNQIGEQLAHDEAPSVLIGRSDGSVSAARLINQADPYGRQLVEFTLPHGEIAYKAAAKTTLSDEGQQHLAEQLGGSLRGEAARGYETDTQHDLPEIARALGDTAMASMGVESRSSLEDEVSTPDVSNVAHHEPSLHLAKAEHNAQVHSILDQLDEQAGQSIKRLADEFDESDEYMRMSKRVIDETAEQLKQQALRLQQDAYYADRIIRVLPPIQQDLQRIRSRFQEVEKTLGRADRQAVSVEETLQQGIGVITRKEDELNASLDRNTPSITATSSNHHVAEAQIVTQQLRAVSGGMAEAVASARTARQPLEGAAQSVIRASRIIDALSAPQSQVSVEDLRRAILALDSVDLSQVRLGETAQQLRDVRAALNRIE